MMRRILIFAAALSLSAPAWANVFSITNDVSLMTCTDRTFPVDRGYQFRLSVQSLQGATPVSLSNRYVRFRLFDSRDGKAVVDKRATIVDEGESRFEVEADFAALQPGTYQAKSESWRVTNDTLAATLSCDVLQLSYSCSTCSASYGGSGDVYVSITNITVTLAGAVTNGYSTNIFQQIVNNNITNQIVTAPGPSSINGLSTGPVTIAASGWGIGATVSGNTITLTNSYPTPAAGTRQIRQWDGTQEVWQALGAPDQVAFTGTNWGRWTATWPTTNTWVSDSGTNWFYAWGATANYSGGGGEADGLCLLPAGTVYWIIVGTSGTTVTNGNPGGGWGIVGASTNAGPGGGGYTVIGTGTNLLIIAAGSGAGYSAGNNIVGGAGGGIYQYAQDGAQASTGGVYGSGAWASNAFGAGAVAGVNAYDTNANGSYLQGGHASTSLWSTGLTGYIPGGGGGLFGGAGACKTNNQSATTVYASSGGGVSWINTNFISYGSTTRGQAAAGGVPAKQDSPAYTSGRGVGSGNAGCAGVIR